MRDESSVLADGPITTRASINMAGIPGMPVSRSRRPTTGQFNGALLAWVAFTLAVEKSGIVCQPTVTLLFPALRT